jgi:hypothetical protein
VYVLKITETLAKTRLDSKTELDPKTLIDITSESVTKLRKTMTGLVASLKPEEQKESFFSLRKKKDKPVSTTPTTQ